MPDGTEDVRTFAQRIKQTYPDYADVPDYELVSRIASKFPQYQSRISSFNVSGAEKLSGVSPTMLRHYLNLYDQFQQAGITPMVRAGFRTAEQENALYKAGYPTKGNDGYNKISPHQEGRALDLSFSNEQKARGRQIMAQYAQANGLHIPSDEPWHIAVFRTPAEAAIAQSPVGLPNPLANFARSSVYGFDESDNEPQSGVPKPPQSPLTTNDAAWHFGTTPDELYKLAPLSGRAVKVLSEAVQEDQRKKSLGQEIPQPSVYYQNEMRKSAGLPLIPLARKPNFSGVPEPPDYLGGNTLIPTDRADAHRQAEARQLAQAEEDKATAGGLRGLARMAGLPTQLLPEAAQDWIDSALAKGTSGLLKFLGGTVRAVPSDPLEPNRVIIQAANKLNTAANEIGGAALQVDRRARRGFLSQTANDVLGGAISSSPAMGLVALGVPLPVAFGLQSYLETNADPDASLGELLKQTGKGATIGALFELPVPVKLNMLGRIGYRMGTVGAGTGAIELASGSDTKNAATNALVNSIFAASGAMKRGVPERPATESRIDSMPEIPDIPVSTISAPRVIKRGGVPEPPKFAENITQTITSLPVAESSASVEAANPATQVPESPAATGEGAVALEANGELDRYVPAKGEISQEGLARIRNAIFARAYGDSPEGLRALEKIAESPDNNVRNITTALLQRAGQFASLKEGIAKGERYELDPTGDLTKALAKMSSLREQNQTVADYLNQRGLFGEDLTPMQKQMLWAFDEFKRSTKAISSILDNYAKGAEAAGSPKQSAFFEKSPPTKEALLEAAIRETVRDGNKEISLFKAKGIPAEPETSRSVPNIDQASKPVSEGVPQPDRSIEVGSAAEANEGVAPQNLGPGAANINEPFPEVKERSFGKQLMADERLIEDLKESLGTSRYYEPIPNNLTAENAREFVDSRGIPEAMKAIRDGSNGMPFHVRSAAGQIVILRLNEAITNLKDINSEAARFALDQATEMSEWAMDYGTRLGQGVQSFAMWAKLLPEGKLLTFKRAVEKARAEHKTAANGEVEKILDTVNQEGLTHEERVAELTKLFGKNKTARSVKSDLDKLVSAAEGGKLTDQKFYEITSERLGLPKYTPEIANRIMDLANAIKDAPEGIPKDRAIFALNKFIAEQKGFGPEDVPYGIYYGNILSGYNTHIVNTIDTALNVISEINGLAINDPRAAAKVYAGLLRGLNDGRLDALMVLTEGRMVTDGKWLEVPRLMEIAQFGKKGGVPIRTNTRTARVTKTIAESKIAYPLNAYKYVTRMLAASDSVFFRSAKEARASLLAYRMAEAEGLKGDAVDTRAREILALDRQSDFLAQAKREGFTGSEAQTRAIELRDFVRNQDINNDSADFAGEATYNHDPHGLLGMFSSGLSRWSDTFKLLKLFVPFTRIVANVTNRGLNYTPWGYKRAAFGYTLGEGLSPEARRLMITRATVGTAGLVTLGAMQYGGLLQIHGNGPSDSERRRQLMSAGWKPYSIQMGSAYVSYLNSPLGLGLSVMGNMTDSQRYHELEQKDAATRGAYAIARIGSTIFSQSFLAGLSRLFEALSNDPSESVSAVKQVMSGTVAAMTTPNLVRDGYKLFDNKQYQANTFTEDLVRNTPFAALALRPTLNAFGEPVTLPRQRFVDIASSDPAWRFVIARGLRVPVPGRTTELKPGERLTAEQYYSLLQTTGPQLKQWIIENRLRMSGMTEDAAQKELSKAAEKFHERALDQMEPSRLIMRSVFRGVPRPPEMASPTP